MSGRYLWNAGMFIFRAEQMLREMERHLPAVSDGLKAIAAAVGTPALDEVTQKAFAAMPAISIDYGVMEKAGGIRVIPASVAWSDVGSWGSLHEVSAVDAGGNVAAGEVILVDTEKSVIKSTGQLVAAVGLRNMAVIVTKDAIMVCPIERTQDVRKVVEELKNRGRKDLL
jgi:mannose-1-phosphate guanylyltransferase